MDDDIRQTTDTPGFKQFTPINYKQSTLALQTRRYYGHPLLWTKSSPSPGENYRGLTENDSHYCGLSLLRTPNYVPRVSTVLWINQNLSFDAVCIKHRFVIIIIMTYCQNETKLNK